MLAYTTLLMGAFTAIFASQTVLAQPGGSTAAKTVEQQAKTVDQPAMTVVGISVKTSNVVEGQGNGEIPKLWARLMQGNLMAQIASRTDANMLAVYSDYEGDQGGAYTYTVGAQVTKTTDASGKTAVPEGMVVVQIPAQKYSVIPSGKGPVYQILPAIWQKIWTLTPEQLGGKRAFRADYEVYDMRAFDPQDTQVDVYVGLK